MRSGPHDTSECGRCVPSSNFSSTHAFNWLQGLQRQMAAKPSRAPGDCLAPVVLVLARRRPWLAGRPWSRVQRRPPATTADHPQRENESANCTYGRIGPLCARIAMSARPGQASLRDVGRTGNVAEKGSRTAGSGATRPACAVEGGAGHCAHVRRPVSLSWTPINGLCRETARCGRPPTLTPRHQLCTPTVHGHGADEALIVSRLTLPATASRHTDVNAWI